MIDKLFNSIIKIVTNLGRVDRTFINNDKNKFDNIRELFNTIIKNVVRTINIIF